MGRGISRLLTSPYALFLALVLILYLSLMWTVGFLSDDWDLMDKSRSQAIWEPLEAHHYSLFVNTLFKGAALGVVTPAVIHFLVLCFHILNTCLVYRIARDGLGASQKQCFAIALFFAINLGGLEALAWCCAAGYVVCATWILLGILYFFREIDHPSTSILKPGLFFFCLQALAFLSWDWGFLFAPLLSVIGLTVRPHSVSECGRRIQIGLPSIALFLAVLLAKGMTGQSLGYQANHWEQGIKSLLVSPALALFPLLTKTFYSSAIGIVSASVLWVGLLLGGRADRRILTLVLLLLMGMIPILLLGHPQSRYFYLFSFFLGSALILFSEYLFRPTVALGVISLFLGVQFAGAWVKKGQWQEASLLATQLREEVMRIAVSKERPLVVVNLPDRYGVEGGVWLPYVWRNGKNSLGSDLIWIYTPDCPNLFHDASICVMERDQITSAFPESVILEVKEVFDLRGKHYDLAQSNP